MSIVVLSDSVSIDACVPCGLPDRRVRLISDTASGGTYHNPYNKMKHLSPLFPLQDVISKYGRLTIALSVD
eukprot:scaffold214578_cov15-Prasinocladus_malaysianus.AAC.1